jgi:ribonuclease VapC
MYLDASAILAIVLNEPDGPALSRRIQQAPTKIITSPVSILEATINLARTAGMAVATAEAAIAAFLATVGAQTVSITPEIGRAALAAYALYGRGFNSRAALNMGDVFSYACAKAYKVALLYKGKDFQHTDLA